MKTKIDVVIVALLCVIVGIVVPNMLKITKAEPLDTYHSGWHLVRETAAEDGATFAAVYALATSEGNFANKDSSTVLAGGPFRIPTVTSRNYGEGYSPGSKWAFIICGGPTDNDTFSFNVVGWAKDNGPAQIICEGAGALGTQDVVIYPDGGAAASIWWVDTITVDEQTKWPSYDGALGAPGVAVFNSADNEIAMLVIETAGIEWLQFVMYDCDGSGTEMTNLTVYGRRW
jgi:hypothetical protein